MGQKKRSASVRAVLTSNGSVSSTGSVIQEGAILSPSNDVEPRSNDSESACKSSGGLQMTGELVLSQENSELVRSTGGSETGRTFLEEVPSVKTECEKALVALRRGNSTKALKLIRDACSRHESNALVQRVRGHICMRLASMIEDLTTKQRHLKEAIEAAHKAVLLSPRSVEYSQFHAQLLFEAATDSKGFEEVVQECRRALEIEDPIDPAKESLHEEGHHKLPTAEARIAQVQQELQNLIQKANIASISNWMKALGNGSGSEEKLRFIHMRKLVDDPMEQRIFQPKRPHEVKKSIKTPEEKRKDIEVRVAAARLLQQKRDCSPPHSDDGNANLQKGSTRQERRKTGNLNARKSNQVQNHDDIMERLKPYWSSLSSSERERMLEVGVDALKQHYNSPKASFASDLLNEALQFALKHKTWRFWVCCSCEERFKDSQEHAEHVMHKHIESLSTKSRRLLPHEIDHDLAEQLLIEDCQPFDGPAAIRLLINACHLGSEEANIATDPCPVVEMNGFHHLVKANATSIETIVEFSGDSSENNNVVREPWLNPNDVRKENESANGVCNGNCHVSKKILQIGKDFRRNELPLVDDEERSKLLQKIFSLFRILIRNKCLASDHMEKIVQYALDELQNFIPDTSIHYEFNHSPVYIRFLPAPQLRRIFNYLHELVNACGLDHPSDNGAPSAGSSIKEDAIYDRLFLNEDFTSLILDEKLLKGIYDSNTAKQVSSSYEIDLQSASQHEAKDGQAFTLSNLQLSWIYQKTDYEFQPAGWKQHFDSCIQQGREVLQALQKEFNSLQNFCDRKCEHLRYEEAVIMAETLCIEELKKRELKADGSFLGHETVLRRQQQEILDNHATGLTSQQKLELEVIKSILREAQTINLPQFPYHNAISVASARLSDSEDEEEDPWRVPDLVPQLDPCIEVAIQRHKERCTSEINKLDARILRSMDSVQRLELKLGALSALDYRAVVLPLVKSFLKAQLEEAAEKDALLKSDAARDAFLAELSQHERNMNERYSDSGRHVKEKVKEKKKNREHRKLKDGKRTQGPGLSIQKASEIGSAPNFCSHSEGGDSNDTMTSTLSELQQSVLEAKLPSRIEVEVEENKVAGTLVLQQKAEEEAELESNKGEDEFRYGQSCCDVESISENNSTSCLTQRSQHHELLRTLHTSNENSSYDSLSFVSEESVVQISSGSTEMTSVDVICAEMQPENYHVSPKNNQEFCDFETIESSSSKPKRGRNRRRKMSRAAHEDWKSRVASEEQNPAAGESSEQTHGDINNIEEAVHNSADNGIRPSEAGLPSKEKQNVDRNRGSVKYSAIAQSSNKTLRELKAEQDAEDRFQADLEQAMQQSLAAVEGISSEVYEQKGLENGSPISMGNRMANLEEVGKGLQNEIGQYNCFLNVVIQSLWHLQRFREEILAISCNYHMHVGDPCVVCALREIFVGLNSPSSTMREGVIAPTTLRIALSNLYAQKDFFQEAQMNDASEVLAVMFDCLHKAFTGESVVSDRDSDTRNGVGLWDCQDHTSCIAHSLFALDVAMQMNCTRCGLESRHLKYTSFFHNINANSLRTAKILYQESSLDELLRLVDMNQFLACDVEVGGCGQQNYIHHLLRLAPHVFIIVLGWQNSRESLEDISATMDTITLEIDAGVIYCGLDKGFKHQLVSVICYYGQHYHCFAFNHELRKWIMFDDSTVKIAGTYEDVVDTCRRGHLQPQVLFYEALSRHG